MVWVRDDVHHASATHYQPQRAKFSDFKPFWEFVGGPVNAGTFGPEVKFTSLPAGTAPNRPSSDGLQFFGIGRVDAQQWSLTMSLHDVSGKNFLRWSCGLRADDDTMRARLRRIILRLRDAFA